MYQFEVMLSGWEVVRFRWGYQLKVMPLTCCIPPSGNPSGCAWTKLKWKFCSTCGVFFLRENDLYYDTSCNKYPREPAQKWVKRGKSDSWLAALCSRRFNWFDLCRRLHRKTVLAPPLEIKTWKCWPNKVLAHDIIDRNHILWQKYTNNSYTHKYV